MRTSQRYRHAKGMGHQILLLGVGSTLVGLMMAPFAIDAAFYFTAQNQLQTATNAAALAGGQAMFLGEGEAEEAALELAAANPVAGEGLTMDDLTFETGSGSFGVRAEKKIPTIVTKLLCDFASKGPGKEIEGDGSDSGSGEGDEGGASQNCSEMTISASAKAVGAPRDTILVLDTSSSMDDLGRGQPFRDVRDAAESFLDMIVTMEDDSPNSLDKVALVKFDRSAQLVRTLTSTHDSPGLNSLKGDLDDLRLYTGSGWNTNYESGLKVALDELAKKGRASAHKTIIFFTDGEPNLPEGSTNINTCLYYKYYYSSSYARNCTRNYVNYMIGQTNTQIDRAKDMDVTIHTIQISDAEAGNSLETLRWLLNDNRWEPGLLDSMANDTEGEQFEAASSDGDAIKEIFRKVAKIVNVKLVSY